MRELSEPVPALFFCGLLFSDTDIFRKARKRLEARFGQADSSPEWPFIHTDYYSQEMGSELTRVFLVFSKMVQQDCLPDAKLICREIEKEFMEDALSGRPPGRRVNIDPGLLTPERLVLATGKNFTHRIYLGRGVFAEITLIATRSGFRTLEWTFPDYASTEILEFWNSTRKTYLAELKKQGII